MDDRKKAYDQTITAVIDRIESAIYLIAALFLIVMAFASFFVVAGDLFQFTEGGDVDVIYKTLNDLLVVLIVAELIQTIVVYIRRHVLDLRLILAAGLTAMIRRVLLFGVEKNITSVDMAITALLIVVLAVAIYLVGRQKVEQPA